MEEVAPGIHRIESDLGPRFMAQYLLVGEERSLLVDTGLADTPDAVLVPALERAGVEPEYLEARDAKSLAPVESLNGRPVVVAVAARFGGARLIDNLVIGG
jgi:pantothenate synthetase